MLTIVSGILALVFTMPAPLEKRLLRFTTPLPHRLFVPDDYDRKKSYPIVLFLHGGAGRGNDNARHLGDGNGMLIEYFVNAPAQRRFPAFVVAPQTISEHDPQLLEELLDSLTARYSIDRDRIYVIGQSLGGYGTLDLLRRQPARFAAAVIIAAGGDSAAVRRLAVPMWFFHGERDGVIPVEQPRRMVQALRRAGGRPRYTEYAGEEHGLAWLVVREKELLPWLFAQRRGR